MKTVDDVDFAARLDRIQKLTNDLAGCRSDAVEQFRIAERIRQEIQLAKHALRPFSEG